jgi:ubiquinol-cytochrome c reductase cytochrome b subunit
MWKALKEWIDIRIGLDDLIREQLTEYRIPRNLNLFHTLGFVALAAFTVQVITGFFLLIYYVPHEEHAFKSVQDIMMRVPFGWLFRLMHTVGSNLIVAVVGLHMLSVFFMQSYKKPREMTWLAGASMLLVTLTFCLSGYLLPWSQLSFWATTIVTNIPTALPVVGDYVTVLLRGGPQVSGATLGRFFALHVGVLPALLLVLVSVHLFLIRRIGIAMPPFGRSGEEPAPWTRYRHEDHPGGQPFYPNFVLRESFVVMLAFALLFAVIVFAPGLFLPADAVVPADPFKTPERIKPEWYFLAAYQMLRIIPSKVLGILMQIAVVCLFVLWPLLDRKEEDNILRRPALLAVFILSIAVLAVLSIWGKYS